MKSLFLLFVLLVSQCHSKSVPDSTGEDQSVVSVYTESPNSEPHVPRLKVYQQIATNIAQRITQPIYRFFGFNKTSSEEKPTIKATSKIELLDESAEKENHTCTITEIGNDIVTRDVEELSEDSSSKADKKPEKITLYNSYLPSHSNLELNETAKANETINEVDSDELGFDDFEDENTDTPREGGFTYFLEIIGSIIQLLFGAVAAWFKPREPTN